MGKSQAAETKHSIDSHASTQQITLGGEIADGGEETTGRDRSEWAPSSKQAQILYYADRDTDLGRIGRWWIRARDEGCFDS